MKSVIHCQLMYAHSCKWLVLSMLSLCITATSFGYPRVPEKIGDDAWMRLSNGRNDDVGDEIVRKRIARLTESMRWETSKALAQYDAALHRLAKRTDRDPWLLGVPTEVLFIFDLSWKGLPEMASWRWDEARRREYIREMREELLHPARVERALNPHPPGDLDRNRRVPDEHDPATREKLLADLDVRIEFEQHREVVTVAIKAPTFIEAMAMQALVDDYLVNLSFRTHLPGHRRELAQAEHDLAAFERQMREMEEADRGRELTERQRRVREMALPPRLEQLRKDVRSRRERLEKSLAICREKQYNMNELPEGLITTVLLYPHESYHEQFIKTGGIVPKR